MHTVQRFQRVDRLKLKKSVEVCDVDVAKTEVKRQKAITTRGRSLQNEHKRWSVCQK